MQKIFLYDRNIFLSAARCGRFCRLVIECYRLEAYYYEIDLSFHGPLQGGSCVCCIYQTDGHGFRAFVTLYSGTYGGFGGTVFENIAYGKEDATMEEVVTAAKAARIHNYIMRLPQGYNTVISEDGGNISKGQKQLLTIARAMLYASQFE